MDSARRDGELDALENMLFALYNDRRDGNALLERFGSYAGVFDASEVELIEFGLTERAAKFFAYCKRIVAYALMREVEHDVLDGKRAIVRYASAYFYGERKPRDVMFVLNERGEVERAVELDGAHALRDVVGNVAVLRAHKVVWVRFSPCGYRRTDRARARDVCRARAVLAALDCALVDYIEYSPTPFASAESSDGRRRYTSRSDERKTPCGALFCGRNNLGSE